MIHAAAEHVNDGISGISSRKASYLERLIAAWDPSVKPVHCSNCKNAKVSGAPEDPNATCAAGHGGPVQLGRLLRAKNAYCFRPAIVCPDFDTMGE